jgi:GAF domain-containing protein
LAQQDSVQVLQQRLEFEQKLVALVDRIHSAKSIDSILIELQAEILAVLDAERMTLYAIDAEKKEIYSKFLTLDTVREIRVPISDVSLAGYCALHRQTLNVADCYDKAELARISTTLHHDNSFDKRTGFRTTQMLAMPILHENRVSVVVIQLINKKHGGRFTKEDEANLSRVARTLGIAFHNQTQFRRPIKFEYLVAQKSIGA